MEPRDIFDGILLGILGITLYVELVGPSISTTRLQMVADAVLGLDLLFYLVLGGILGIGFLGYMFVYLPEKQSQNPTQ